MKKTAFLLAAMGFLLLVAQPSYAQYYYNNRYYKRYPSRGFSERRVTVQRQGEDPYAFRRNKQDVNMNLWNQAQQAHPAASPSTRNAETSSSPNSSLRRREDELEQREERIKRQEQKINSQNSVYEKF